MRIGVNCFLLSAPIGGLKQYFQTLFRELLVSDAANDYVFFYFNHNVRELEALGVDRWKKDAILLNDQAEVANHLDKIDLYFCPFGALWPIPLPLPTVVTVVDLQEKYYPEYFTETDHWNRDYHYFGSTRQATRVITISEFSKNSIREHHGASRERIDVVYLCPQQKFNDALKTPVVPPKSLPESFIFYPANHWKHKNHQCLIDALLILRRESGLEIPAVFTGYAQGNGYPLVEKVREYGLNAVLFEFVSVEELAYLYKNARMLCFPSLFEGFGIPLVEAMAAGCPVACSNTSSIPEVVGEAALLFDPADPADCARAIRTLYTDGSVRECKTRLGIEQAKLFSPERMAADHLASFEKAAAAYSPVRYLKNKYLFNPLHNRRMLKRRPRPGG